MTDTPARARILVADDDPRIRRVVTALLEKAQYETLQARNGREAVEVARARRPDLILMDVMMPVLDGFTACKMLKSDAVTKDIPVIICTVKNRKDDLIAALHAGAQDFLIKPFTKGPVVVKIEKALHARRHPPA